MKKLNYLFYVVGGIQIVLGLFYAFAPEFFLLQIGHTAPAPDLLYPFGMLASRFLVIGVIFVYLAKNASENLIWINAMIFIQILDLLFGVFYTATGVVTIADSAFPMFNATWITLLLWFWKPKCEAK
jgi:hypothetical protein